MQATQDRLGTKQKKQTVIGFVDQCIDWVNVFS